MKISFFAQLKGENPYVIDETDQEALLGVLAQIEEEMQKPEWKGVPSGQPLREERNAVRVAYFQHETIASTFQEALNEAFQLVKEKKAPSVQTICATPDSTKSAAPKTNFSKNILQ